MRFFRLNLATSDSLTSYINNRTNNELDSFRHLEVSGLSDTRLINVIIINRNVN